MTATPGGSPASSRPEMPNAAILAQEAGFAYPNTLSFREISLMKIAWSAALSRAGQRSEGPPSPTVAAALGETGLHEKMAAEFRQWSDGFTDEELDMIVKSLAISVRESVALHAAIQSLIDRKVEDWLEAEATRIHNTISYTLPAGAPTAKWLRDRAAAIRKRKP